MSSFRNQLKIQFDNTYHRDLEGFYVPWRGIDWTEPKVVKLNLSLAEELGLDFSSLSEAAAAAIFTGGRLPSNANPLAQVYAGHQFGSFNPQLGDGRALLLGEVIDINGNRRDIQLKGSGKTPFSRGGDGKAAIGPVLREYIISEAMHALGVPTTRALAAVATGENVFRETPLPGAVLTRVASSHLRIGTFEYFAARGETNKIKQLADYAIARHYPHLIGGENRYLEFLESVGQKQAALVAKWMSLGFIHGVMNTDNTTISGETIDYGPCAFMDAYDPAAVYSAIDTHGRYQYQNQPSIAIWNQSRLADCLLPLIDENENKGVEIATEILNAFPHNYFKCWLGEMRKKIGLTQQQEGDMDLMKSLLHTMEGQNVDFTELFRSLIDSASGNEENTKSMFNDPTRIIDWLKQWNRRLESEPAIDESITLMRKTNPIYIPRNHKVEETLNAATHENNFSLFTTLVELLGEPTKEQKRFRGYEKPAPPSFGPYQTFCGT